MKTHWKKLTNPDYIGSYDFQPGEERNVQILNVKRENVTGPDGKKEECSVAQLKGQKPLILNSTNQKAITTALGTPYIEDWAGKHITLTVQRVKAFGDWVDAIRVKPTAPTVKKEALTPAHSRWDGAKQAILAGNVTLEQIRSQFELSKENEAKLLERVKEVVE